MCTFRTEVQSWFFQQILACYQDMAARFENHNLSTLLESSKAKEILLKDGGYDDRLIVVPTCSELIHIIEKDGDVKMVKTMQRKDVSSSALFSNLSADDLSVVAGY